MTLDRAINSLLAQPGYRRRDGQLLMMHAVAETISSAGRHLVVEAPTGTGKTEGLLLPALLTTQDIVTAHFPSGKTEERPKRVVVATHSNLLAAKAALEAAPRVEAVLGLSHRTALGKGRSNYVCLERLYRYAPSREQADHIDRLAKPLDGDLDRMGAGADVRAEIADRPRYCLGSSCEFLSRCYAAKARARIKAAGLVVTTQALLLADVRIGYRMLGRYDVLMVDEAQHLPEVATSALTAELTSASLLNLSERSALPHTVRVAASRVAGAFMQLVDYDPRVEHETVIFDVPPKPARDALERFVESVSDIDQSTLRGDARVIAGRALELADLADAINVSWASPGMVLYASQEGASIRLGVAPLGVAGYLRRSVYWSDEPKPDAEPPPGADADAEGFGEDEDEDGEDGEEEEEEELRAPRSVVAVSATLRTTGPPDGFGYFLQRAGLRDARTLVVASPFSEDRALLYLPRDAPETPANGAVSATFAARLAAETLAVQSVVGGGALVLCTSWAWLDAIRQAFEDRVPEGRLFCQVKGGSADALLSSFLDAPANSVLVGAKRFWEGVDVPGERIRTVAISRLPFGNPRTDMLLRARCQAADKRQPGSGFGNVMMPEMIITLRQGAGRLVRTETDWGVVLVYDRRCFTKSYGGTARRALGFGMVSDLAGLRRFAEQRRVAGA